MKKVKGYKIFSEDWSDARSKFDKKKQYYCPGKFEENVIPKIGEIGMHFCKNAVDCFKHTKSFKLNFRFAEVIAYGDIVEENDECATNKLEIVREISKEEILKLCNLGNWNTGYGNSGDYNSGNYNTGDCNTGNCNGGDNNSGNKNSGCYNSGNDNLGNCNIGDYNTGNCNLGNYNDGDNNIGNCNSGDNNIGSYNQGNKNIGDWNKSSYNVGCFNTSANKIYLFNKLSDFTYEEWINSEAYKILMRSTLICLENDKWKLQTWWDNLITEEKQTIYNIPNFDKGIFEECLGIKID